MMILKICLYLLFGLILELFIAGLIIGGAKVVFKEVIDYYFAAKLKYFDELVKVSGTTGINPRIFN